MSILVLKVCAIACLISALLLVWLGFKLGIYGTEAERIAMAKAAGGRKGVLFEKLTTIGSIVIPILLVILAFVLAALEPT